LGLKLNRQKLPETGWKPFGVKSANVEIDESLSVNLRVDRMSASNYDQDGLSMSISALSVAQIRALSTTAIQSLSTSSIQSLTTTQVSAFTTTGIGAFSSTQFGDFSTTQVRALQTTQIPSINSSVSFTSGQLLVLSAQQLEQIPLKLHHSRHGGSTRVPRLG